MDGVLVDTEEIHYSALLQSIRELTSLTELDIIHIIKKDGKSTTEKLKLLKNYYSVNESTLTEIDKLKQSYSVERLKRVTTTMEIVDTVNELAKHYVLALVSNSRLSNINLILNSINLTKTFSSILTPDSGHNPKPSADMFTSVMRTHNILPNETLILEDSPSGIEAGVRSAAYVMSINSLTDTNLQNINYVIKQITNDSSTDGGKRQQIYSSRIY